MTLHYIDTPAGRLAIGATNGALVLCDWVDSPHFIAHKKKLEGLKDDEEYCIAVSEQIYEYFDGKRTKFDIGIAPIGSDFQRKVWKELTGIPFGRTTSYSEIASRLGMPKASRSIAGAIAQNPISIIIPCHRVIGSNGSLTGYAGGIPAKRLLLELEKI